MSPEFPYQLVTFLDIKPPLNELLYDGASGWYPHLVLKRRFGLTALTEEELLHYLQDFCDRHSSFSIQTTSEYRPERMPVDVVGVVPTNELMSFHEDFITETKSSIQSRYPERDGAHFLPHITSEYDGKPVINADKYSDGSFKISEVCLVKDITDRGTCTLQYFTLR